MPNNYAKIYILTPETFAKQDVKPPVYIQKHPIDEMMSEYYSDTLSLLPTSIWLTEEDGKQVAIYRTDLDAYILGLLRALGDDRRHRRRVGRLCDKAV